MKKNMTPLLMNHAACAQTPCAVSFCPATSAIFAILLDAILLGSIIILPVSGIFQAAAHRSRSLPAISPA